MALRTMAYYFKNQRWDSFHTALERLKLLILSISIQSALSFYFYFFSMRM
jgi:hypothetical protein